MNIPNHNLDLLTAREAAAFLRSSRAKLYRLLRDGELKGHKVGSTWVFYRRDLIAYIERPLENGRLDKAEIEVAG